MMNRTLILLLAMLSTLLGVFTAKAQRNTKYYFQGCIYQDKEQPCPYNTVVLYEKGDDTPVAATMTSPIGTYSFEGVPVDEYKEYIFEILRGDKLYGKYLNHCFSRNEKPPFPPGNISTNLPAPHDPTFYDRRVILPTAEQKKMRLIEFLKHTGMELENGTFFFKGEEAPLAVFVNNGNPVTPDKVLSILARIPMIAVEQIEIIRLKSPNSYYSGAISVELLVGEKRTFPPKYYDNGRLDGYKE